MNRAELLENVDARISELEDELSALRKTAQILSEVQTRGQPAREHMPSRETNEFEGMPAYRCCVQILRDNGNNGMRIRELATTAIRRGYSRTWLTDMTLLSRAFVSSLAHKGGVFETPERGVYRLTPSWATGDPVERTPGNDS